MITGNAHKYPVSAQCGILGIARSAYYFYRDYNPKPRIHDGELAEDIERIYKANRGIYGARKLKSQLSQEGKQVPTKRIIRVMKTKDATPANGLNC